MKVLILDNNISDIERIKEFFGRACPVEQSFELSTNFKEFNQLYIKNQHNVLFVNIDNDTNEVLKFLEEHQDKPSFIIITSQQNNMIIEAYKHKILGYLPKPITIEEIEQVVFRINKRSHLIRGAEKQEDYSHFQDLIAKGEINRIALTTLDGYVIVHYDDIIRCEANGNYTSVYFHDGSFLMLTKTLKHYASKLEAHGFFRVHKTHLVNIDYIRTYVKGKNSCVELKDGSSIEVSSRKKQTLVEILNN